MTIRFFLPLIAALFLGMGPIALAQADAPTPAPLPAPAASPVTVYSFGKENPDCQEWTNACQTCARDDKGAPQCSTAGIACTPALMVCKVSRAK